MKPVWFILFSIIISLGVISCEKNNGTIYTPPQKPMAGPGGTATVNIIPYHNGFNIDSGVMYIKYNTLIYPDSTYDDSAMVKRIGNTNVARFFGLRSGDYFIYAEGWDNNTSERVWGLSTLIINDSTSVYTLEIQTQSH